ncbi:MAG: DNA polymerase I, partial [Planctomycetota bacterium]
MPDPLTTSDRPRLFLLDGMALAYRAHFAMMRSPLATSRGEATSAVFGFLAALDRIRQQETPDEIVVAFDAPEPTFRHRLYPEYKATREKMPEEMIPQLDWIRRAVEGEGLPFVRLPGWEADDLIGTLARQAQAAGRDVWIVSGDKDMYQLVTDHVRLYNVMKPGQAEVHLVAAPEVEEKFGVGPEKVVDVLALMGDTSDNVPGVPGVGPKRARDLIRTWGSLDEVLAHAAEIPQKKLSENLREYADQARLSRELVTIDVEAPVLLEDLAPSEPDAEVLRSLYLELEFSGRLDALDGGDAGLGAIRYRTVTTPAAVKRLVAALKKTRDGDGFVLDTETTDKNPMRADLVGLSFSWKPHEAWYVPVNLDPPMFGGGKKRGQASGRLFDRGTGADTDAVLDLLRPVLEDAAIPKTGQNIKYDLHVLLRHGVDVKGVAFDTMVADWCVDPGGRTHNMDEMAMRRLGIRKIPTSDLLGRGRNQITMAEVPIEDVSRYACEDADVTLRLRKAIEPELAEKEVEHLFHEVEVPLIPVLTRMEHHGVRLDVDLLARISEDLDARAKAAEARIHHLAGETFNIRSNAVLGRILFDDLRLHEKLGRKKPKRTAKGTGYATDERTLLDLAPFDELPALVLEYRSLTKLKSTYVDALPEVIDPETGRVHTTFHQTGTATGRLSSSDPNLQNIPIRTEEGRAIRKAFVPEEGWLFLSADYSQIELRLMAHLSGDEGLIEAFRSGEDVHRATAARIFKVPPEEVTPELRGRAKAVNFGVIYGMGPQRLARETKVTLEEARSFIDQYFETYPGVRAFLDRTVAKARERGYVQTLLGRRRYLPELSSKDARVMNQAENVAVNTPLQGTAADLIKLAMIRIDERLGSEGHEARMLVQIHDELLLEVPSP